MSNTNQSPEQSFGHGGLGEQAKARRREVADARFGMQRGLFGMYPSVLDEDARRKASLAIEGVTHTQPQTLASETLASLESLRINSVRVPDLLASVEPTLLSPEQPIEDETQAAWMQQLRDQVNQAHEQGERAA